MPLCRLELSRKGTTGMDGRLCRHVPHSLLQTLKTLVPTWYPRDTSEDKMLTRRCFKHVGQKTLGIVFLGEQKLFQLLECLSLCCISIMEGNEGEAVGCLGETLKTRGSGPRRGQGLFVD